MLWLCLFGNFKHVTTLTYLPLSNLYQYQSQVTQARCSMPTTAIPELELRRQADFSFIWKNVKTPSWSL